MDAWELKPQRLGSLWLKASVTWKGERELFWLKASMIRGRWAVPLLNYALAFVLQLMMSVENLCYHPTRKLAEGRVLCEA
jgi:hypothetical protein